jgi:plastocyanin
MQNSPIDARFERLFRWALAGTLVLGVLAGVLLPRMTAQAQDMEPETYTVLAGTLSEYNTAILTFSPNNLQVHRGDVVQWVNAGIHNIHFAEGLTPLVTEAEIEGVSRVIANPAVIFPSVESGAIYQGGDVNSGIGFFSDPPTLTFSLVMDVEPGTYSYFCDLHPGMAGTITVVDDATAIPSPAEVLAAGSEELAMQGFAATEAAFGAALTPRMANADGVLAVDAGLQTGFGAALQFFPAAAVIEAGQSVTWTVPADSMEPHTVTWPPIPPGSEFEIIPQEAGPPILAMGGPAFPSIESGSTVGADGAFNSGIMFPGQTYSLTFTEPGVYNYICFIHPGMNAAVVVMPSME